MKPPDELIAELMSYVRAQLYHGRPDKKWFSQQDTVKRALTYPAAWLEDRKVPLSQERYREILTGIIDTMVTHGNLSAVTYPSAYLLDCVQKHMAHHGDEYYQEGKAIRNRVSVFMTTLDQQKYATVPVLAEVHSTLEIGKRKRKLKPGAKAVQPDLL